MKKTFKRAGVAVLSMAMLLSMGAVGAMSASATNNFQVNQTSTLTSSNSKYKVYKVADNLGNMEGSFELPSGKSWSNYSSETANNATMKGLAATFYNQIGTTSPVNTDGTALGTGLELDDGYYLVVVETTATNDLIEPALVQIKDGEKTDDVATTPKTQTIGLTKEIQNVNTTNTDSVGNVANNATNVADSTAEVGVGDVVAYDIVTQMPRYNPNLTSFPKKAKITDTTVHLNDNNSSIKVYSSTDKSEWTEVAIGSGVDTMYSVVEDGTIVKDEDKTGFVLTFTDKGMKDLAGKYIKVSYTATVLAGASDGTTANENTAKLTYNRNYMTDNGSDETDGDKDVEDKADVFTAPLTIHKTDGTSDLNGVKFTLKTSDGKYVKSDGTVLTNLDTDKATATYTTAGTGLINYTGLKDGTYTLTEEEGASDHRDLAGAVTIKIDAKANESTTLYDGTYEYTATATDTSDNSYVTNNNTKVSTSTVTIANPPINTLPGTGGMGTVLFTVGGAAIVLAAGAMFVVYMRKRKNEEQ